MGAHLFKTTTVTTNHTCAAMVAAVTVDDAELQFQIKFWPPGEWFLPHKPLGKTQET